jgi:hypothetical protein
MSVQKRVFSTVLSHAHVFCRIAACIVFHHCNIDSNSFSHSIFCVSQRFLCNEVSRFNVPISCVSALVTGLWVFILLAITAVLFLCDDNISGGWSCGMCRNVAKCFFHEQLTSCSFILSCSNQHQLRCLAGFCISFSPVVYVFGGIT